MIISMIFDLVNFKLVIALMALTSTATAQSEALFYGKPGCTGSIMWQYNSSMVGTAENSCTARCLYIATGAINISGAGVGIYFVKFNSPYASDVTICYAQVNTGANGDPAQCIPPGDYFTSFRSDGGCQKFQIPLTLIARESGLTQTAVPIKLQCYNTC
jgi:hypothetical protein